MHEVMRLTTGKRMDRRRARRVRSCAAVLAVALLSPGTGWTMAADGALITNVVTATYHGMAGFPATGNLFPRYTMSYLATANILISCPVVAITKQATPTAQAASGTVTFTICAINSSLQASAWNIVVTDRLLDNTEYVNPSFTGWGGTWVSTYSSNNTTWSGANTQPANGQDAPYYLRWSILTIGPGRSACISFQAAVL